MPTIPASIRLLAGLAILAVAACDSTGSGSSTTPEPTSAADLAGTSWTLVSIGGTPVVDGSGPHLIFGVDGHASGSTGCNSMSGDYTTDGAALTFGPMATTRMACEENLMAQESAVLEALTGVSGWEIVTAMSPIDTDENKSVTAYCPAGKVAVGGGGFIGTNTGGYVSNSFAQNSLNGEPGRAWAVYATRTDGASWRLVGQAICIQLGG